MKEMEAVVESEFAEVFVPLVMGLATYHDICVVQKAKKDWKPCDLKPFEVTTDCLQVFFLKRSLRVSNGIQKVLTYGFLLQLNCFFY